MKPPVFLFGEPFPHEDLILQTLLDLGVPVGFAVPEKGRYNASSWSGIFHRKKTPISLRTREFFETNLLDVRDRERDLAILREDGQLVRFTPIFTEGRTALSLGLVSRGYLSSGRGAVELVDIEYYQDSNELASLHVKVFPRNPMRVPLGGSASWEGDFHTLRSPGMEWVSSLRQVVCINLHTDLVPEDDQILGAGDTFSRSVTGQVISYLVTNGYGNKSDLSNRFDRPELSYVTLCDMDIDITWAWAGDGRGSADHQVDTTLQCHCCGVIGGAFTEFGGQHLHPDRHQNNIQCRCCGVVKRASLFVVGPESWVYEVYSPNLCDKHDRKGNTYAEVIERVGVTRGVPCTYEDWKYLLKFEHDIPREWRSYGLVVEVAFFLQTDSHSFIEWVDLPAQEVREWRGRRGIGRWRENMRLLRRVK